MKDWTKAQLIEAVLALGSALARMMAEEDL